MVLRAQSADGIAGPLTVRAAVEGYLEFLEAHGKSAVDARASCPTLTSTSVRRNPTPH